MKWFAALDPETKAGTLFGCFVVILILGIGGMVLAYNIVRITTGCS